MKTMLITQIIFQQEKNVSFLLSMNKFDKKKRLKNTELFELYSIKRHISLIVYYLHDMFIKEQNN